MQITDRFKTDDGKEFWLVIKDNNQVVILKNGEEAYKNLVMSTAIVYMGELRRFYEKR